MSFGWGIAATGRIAREVGAVMLATPGMHVAAVASRDAGRAATLAGELGAPRSYRSYDALAADPAVDGVYVATPHAGHAAVAAPALSAAKAVLCEKPMTATLAETERLVALARASGTFLMEAVWMRFNPPVQQLVELVGGGSLGEIRLLEASFGFAAPPDPASRLWDPALGGGALLDLGLYTVDLARLLLGSPSSVEATGSLAATGVDAESSLLLTFPGGARAQLTQSLVAALPNRALLIGSRGWAQLGPSFHAATELQLQVGSGAVMTHDNADRNAGFVGELVEVVRCVAEGRSESAVMPLADSVETMRVLEQARRLLG